MRAMKDIYLITHAEATHHLDDVVGGWFDSELTPHGRQQAEAIATHLAQVVGQRQAEIYSSDLLRASQTARPIGHRLGIGVSETPALREISYGVAGGRPQAWLDERYTPAPDDDRMDHRGNIEGAESRRDVAGRVYPFLTSIMDRPAAVQIVVTHGFTASIFIAAWMKVPIEGIGFISFPTAKASITHLHQDDFFRNRSLRSLGGTSHLSVIGE